MSRTSPRWSSLKYPLRIKASSLPWFTSTVMQRVPRRRVCRWRLERSVEDGAPDGVVVMQHPDVGKTQFRRDFARLNALAGCSIAFKSSLPPGKK